MKPFIALDHLDEQKAIYKKYGFRITNFICQEHVNELISVSVDWTAEKERHFFRHIDLSAHHYTSENRVSFELEFKDPSLAINFHGFDLFPSLEIGIEPQNESSKKISWDCFSFENTKYGVIVTFVNNNWMEKAKIIFEADSVFLSNLNRKLKN